MLCREDERDGAADIDEERARTEAKRRKVKRQSRQVSTYVCVLLLLNAHALTTCSNLEVRVLPRDGSSVVHKTVAPEILAFKQSEALLVCIWTSAHNIDN